MLLEIVTFRFDEICPSEQIVFPMRSLRSLSSAMS